MKEDFRLVHLEHQAENLYPVKKFGVANARKVSAFHQSFPEYTPTPLAELNGLAKELGIASLHVKDESYRFGLNAFKVLGGSYAIGNYIAQRLGMNLSELPYERLVSDEIKKKLGSLTFVTATDGNHGRGVAWTANRLGQKSVVYMPKGSAIERLENIRALGSDASITELNYDDAVRLANEDAEKNGWVMVQDTSWEGYEDIPSWIMEGYTTMAYEAVQQLNGEKPTHIFLQAGVGALAGGITAFFTDLYGDSERPVITIVEPEAASCLFQTAQANDGQRHFVAGDMNTIMAGLACGEPCTIGWNIMHDHADNFIAMGDQYAARGMRVLGNPIKGDPQVIAGESGAATMGAIIAIMTDPALEDVRKTLGLNASSRILCFSTEGDTDKKNYRDIVWNGLYPNL